MPLLEHEASRAGRLRVVRRAQVPFAVGIVFIAIATAVVLPEQFVSVVFLSGIAIGVLSTVLAVVVPWERWPSSAMAIIAVLDLVAVAFIRTELIGIAPAASLLCIFPVLWLAYGFAQRMMIVAVAGTLFITVLPFILIGRVPVTAVEWLNVALLPVFTIGIAVAVNIGARRLRSSQRAVRKQSEQREISLQRALRAEILAESIIETVDAGIAFYTADGTLGLANQHAHDMVEMVGFRLDMPPYAGFHVLEQDRKTRIPLDEQIIPRALRGEVIANHLEWLGPVGQQRAIVAASKPVYQANGELLGTVIAAHDVTELANAISVREEFLTTVSHELRTPLTSIHGYLDLVVDDAEIDAPGLLPMLQTIQRNATKLEHRVQELLTAATAEVELDLATIDAVQLTSALIEEVNWEDVPIIFTSDTDKVLVSGDAAQLRKTIRELITNAVKFTPELGTLRASLINTSDGVDITVTDTGVGMTPDEVEQAFDKFYRTPYAITSAIQGVGLGLHSARLVAEAHHGSLTLDSAAGLGTTARLTLPH